ncbi:hypothetical protein Hden_0114 [Hyphomicrobium denitrificans ATCC 51888]|uniref:Uncharacterized protein n=2 Tax=Hyphomicrobium denitrificans (strain ATCC 51888 / DSM 1869 / NCIMB 11706 / TK 0415) TaxID=582899 RepID=D8JQ20_HYPDA|nr:hypothetical protein [Hyphomicrobium denitrificans]ADJ21941.1 hypothetical protein Hden_0114 [Hyphomicrobium denitrificans ATCC 51888]
MTDLESLRSLQKRIREDSASAVETDASRSKPRRTRTNLSGFTVEQRYQHDTERRRKWRQNNPDKERARHKRYYAKNTDKHRATCARVRMERLEERRQKDIETYRLTRSDWRKDIVHKVSSARRRAGKLGMEFDLDHAWTLEQVERLRLDPRCPATGVVMSPGRGQNRGKPFPTTPSIDRIDPARGYTKDNVRFVCYFVNCAKRDFENAAIEAIVLDWAARIQESAVSALIAQEEAKEKADAS